MSVEDESVMSLGGFWALAFFFVLFSFGGSDRIRTSTATEVATGSGARGEKGGVSLLGRLDADDNALVPSRDLFLMLPPPRVLTIVAVCKEAEQK